MPPEDRAYKVLVVDDEERNLKLMGTLLANGGCECLTASDGVEALEKARSAAPDLIILDVMMPGMDGYETCRNLKLDPATRDIPVVMVTALTDRESRLQGLQSGAIDFLSKPIDSTELMVRTKNLLKIKEFSDFLKRHNAILEAEVRKRTAELEESRDKIKEGYLDTLERLTIVSEYKDEETTRHIKRVGHYCATLAKRLGWAEVESETISYASLMHDIGKVAIPAEILLKPARLTPEEYALMKTHTTIGGRILNGSPSRILQMAERIALTHHERWDGGGYPGGLRGEEIPAEGRIMNIADQYDALRSRRPYKPPFDHERTFKIITEGDGRTMPDHFDPQVLAVFKETHASFAEIFEAYKD